MSDDVRVKFSALTPVTNQAQVVPAINALVANLTPLVGQHKNKNERAVQWSDLLSLGLANVKGLTEDGYPDYGLPPPEKPDMSTPPAIVNFKVEASFNFVTMSWDQPRYRNHAFVEVWRAVGFKKLLDDSLVPTVLSDAVFRLMTASIVCSDIVLPGDKWRYWARNVSKTGVVGPWTSIDGHLAEVPEDPAYLIDKISGEIREGDLYPALGAKIDASYNGVNEHADSLAQYGQVLAQHTSTISAQGATIMQQGSIITSQGDLLTQHTTTLSQHGNSIVSHGQILTTHDATLVSHGQSLATQNAQIIDLKSVTEAQGGVLAQHTQTLAAHGTAIQQQATINTEQGALINAAWTVRIDSGNAVSGFGLMVDGATGRSDFIIRADRFAIAAPQAYDQNGKPVVNTAAFPFIVDVTNPASPKVLIKNAYIDQAFIQTLVTGSLVADRITGQTLTGTHIRGGDMAIGSNFSVDSAGSATMANAFIRGTMQSSNYGAGTTGWQIHNNGNAEFNNAVLRGTVYATGGWFQGTVYAEKLVGGAYTKKVYPSANHAFSTTGSWRTAASVRVARGMAVPRTLEVSGQIARGYVSVTVGSAGSAPVSQELTGYFEVRILRDGAVISQYPVNYTASVTSTPSSGPQQTVRYPSLGVSLRTAVPTDGGSHLYEFQFRTVNGQGSIGQQVNGVLAGSDPSDDLCIGVMYIENGDLA